MTFVRNAVFIVVAATLLAPNLSRADEKILGAPAQGLPLRHVSLFSSGVGYFGRAGKVDGDGDVELYFQRDDLNDVLKSLVITEPQPIRWTNCWPGARKTTIWHCPAARRWARFCAVFKAL